MVELAKPFFMTLFINILLVIAGFQFVDATLLSDFVGVDDEGNIEGESDVLQETIPDPNKEDTSFLQDLAGNALSLIDSLGVIIDFIGLLVNVVLAPIQLFIELPNIMRVFVGFPLLIFNMFGYVSLIRSGA